MQKFTGFEHRKRIYAACISTLLFLMAQGGVALSADYWMPVEGTDCQVWSDEPLAQGEIIRWSGGCSEGKLSGMGVLEVFAGDKRTLWFEGTMRSGMAEGPGKVEAAVKDGTERYDGGFTNGFFEGYGAYELSDGSRYEGGFRNDRPNGFGVV